MEARRGPVCLAPPVRHNGRVGLRTLFGPGPRHWPAWGAIALAAVAILAWIGLSRGAPHAVGARGALAQDLSQTRPLWRGPAFRPHAYAAPVGTASAVGLLRCRRPGLHPYGMHIELFAAGRMVLVPAGIGLAPPLRTVDARVLSERCAYPLRTTDPTGVVQVDRELAARRPPILAQLFGLWGQPLSHRRLAGFSAPRDAQVMAFVDGRRWPGDPGAIPLSRHSEIVLYVGQQVAAHAAYRFPAGL